MTPEQLAELGFYFPRKYPQHGLCAVQRYVFTVGLVLDVQPDGCYGTRYCYEHAHDAIAALALWDGTGDPSGPWIKQKGIGVDRLNPNLKDDFDEKSRQPAST